MRHVICYISLLATASLVGCGQTGSLQLPNDPNYDKRAQYLLYKDGEKSINKTSAESSTAVQDQIDQEKKDSKQVDLEQADKQAAASDLIETN